MRSTLYKKSKTGKIQQWIIEAQGRRFRTVEGFVDGAQTSTEWTECIEKNSGRANATTPEEQALKEAEARIKKQKDKGWTENIDDVNKGLEICPMLAHKWSDHKEWMLNQSLIAMQPKLDGIRCIATKDGLFTRTGKPIVAVPHILEEIQRVYATGLVPEGVKFDGELYNHDYKDDFNAIVSIVRKQKVTEEDIAKAEASLQYHVYDLDMPDNSFLYRSNLLTALLANTNSSIQIVETSFLASNEQGQYDFNVIESTYQRFLEEGYEGQMFRSALSLYDHNRSKSLLKRKEFIDEEFTIVDIEEGRGNRSGMMGRIRFETFDANARGTHEFFKDLLLNKEQYIGKKATVRYQNLSADGIPRFPVVVAIRDYE